MLARKKADPKKRRSKGKGLLKRSSPDASYKELEAIIVEQSVNIKKFDRAVF